MRLGGQIQQRRIGFRPHRVLDHVGDRVGFGLSHPCTAFDKWRTVLLVSDDYQIREQISTWFH